MKKNVKLLSLILGTACLILSCTQNEGNDKVVEPENTVNIPAYSSGKVLKNKVVSTGSDVYYEYLTFTSQTGGTYALYKEGAKVTSYTNKKKKKKKVPYSVTYDAATKK